jgi:hypothetical protein
MVRKIKQWVPIDGTRWRNEIANGHENHGEGVHYGVAQSKFWRTWSRRNLIPWKSCEWPRRPRNVSWECARPATPISDGIAGGDVTVSAQSRDIQESAPLFRDLPVRDRARIGCRLNQSIGLARGNDLRQGEMIALIKVETILNL